MVAHFSFHQDRCVGCGSCVIACINENHTDVEAETPHRTVGKNESVAGDQIEITYFSTACMHCEEAPCLERCPKLCYTRDHETGLVILDHTDCIGCRLCAKVCEFNAIHFGKDKKATKCNGCMERLKDPDNPRLPMCVVACPRHAITIDDTNEVAAEGRECLKNELKKTQATVVRKERNG